MKSSSQHKVKAFDTGGKELRERIMLKKKTAMKTFHHMVTLFLHLIMPEILGNFPGT